MNCESQAIELIRVSTDAQAKEDRGGLPAQRAACKDIAKRNNLKVKWTVEMAGVSGAAVMSSKEMQQLIQILKSGQCGGVIMKEASRLMRPENFEDWALLQVFKENGVRIYTPDQSYNLSNPHDAMMFGIQMSMAGLERTTIMRRCVEGKRALKLAGKCAGAAHTLPFAVLYDRKRERYEWDESKVSKVQRLFDLFVGGVTSFTELARKSGLSYYVVPELLRNPIYTGVRVYSHRSVPTGVVRDGHIVTRKQKLPESEQARVRVFDKGIVSDDTFARAQKLLAVKRQMRWHAPDPKTDRFVFRGLLKCGVCESHLIAFRHKAGGTERDYYACQSTIGRQDKWDASAKAHVWRVEHGACSAKRMRRERVDAVVSELIETKLTDPQFLFNVLTAHRREIERGTDKNAAARLQKEIASIEEKQRRLKVLFVKGDLDESEYETAKAGMLTEAQAAQQRLAQVTKAVPTISVEQLTHAVAGFQRWAVLNTEDRRKVLTSLVPVIRVTGKGNGGRGAGANTKIVVNGFFLTLTGDDVQPETMRGTGRKRPSRANIGATRLVSPEGHLQTAPITDQSVYIPLVS